MKTLKILIVDDHQMVRDGIRSMLESQNKKYNFRIEEAESGEEGVEQAIKNKFDIILLDYQLPTMSGAIAAKQIMKAKPASKILALSNYNEYMYVDNMIKAGVRGFILKNISPEEIVTAIENVLNGKPYYSNEVALKLLTFNRNDIPDRNAEKRNKLKELLSKRELQILELIAKELTSEEIAKKVHLSKRTIDSHRSSILAKLQVKNTAGLIKYTLPYLKTPKEA